MRSFSKWPSFFALLLSILMMAPVVYAQDGGHAPPEPDNLLNNGDFARGEDGWGIPNEHVTTAFTDDVPGGPGWRVLQLKVTPQPGDVAWNIALRQTIEAALPQGQQLGLRFWARSPESLKIGAFVEQAATPYAKLLAGEETLSPDWKQYEVRGQAAEAYQQSGTSVVFHLGYGTGTIEITDVRLFDPNGTIKVVRSNATPDKPQSLIENGDFSAPLETTWGTSGPNGSIQMTPVDALPAPALGIGKAVRFTVATPVGINPWDIQFAQKVQKPVSLDDAIYVRAWMRSPERVRVDLVYEQAEAPNTKTIMQTVKLTPQWKEYRFMGYAKQAFAPGESQSKIFFGYDTGTVEVAGLRVEDYGKAPPTMFDQTLDYWGGVEHSDAWRAPALARIEKIRKGDVTVHVVDAKGRPVPNARVSIEQQSHYFRWGSAGPVSRLVDTTSPDNLRYQQEAARLFNTWVFESDLKWPSSEQPGMLDTIDQGIAWLNMHGIHHIRGHNMVWGSAQYLPAGLLDKTPDEIIAAIQNRIKTIGAREAGKVYVWDVVNEASNETALWDKIGWENFANAYKWAHEADPKALLSYNDYHGFDTSDTPSAARQTEYGRIQYLIDHGAPLDIIGEQSHMGPHLIPMDNVVKDLDQLAKFGKRIEITEFDVGVPDDKQHAEYVRDFLTAAFSHPDVDAFLMWGFWEGSHWRAADGGAMFRKDWSKRPAQEAYEDLVLHQWWTRFNGQTGKAGSVATRAFYGTHTLRVEKNGRRVKREIWFTPGQKIDLTVKLGG